MNDKPIPPAVAEFALDQLAAKPLTMQGFTHDAENYGPALNEAGWTFIHECPETSALLFNNTKVPLRAAILKYAELVKPALVDPELEVLRARLAKYEDAEERPLQSSGVVLPERFEMEPYQTVNKGSTNYKAGFNKALKLCKEVINSSPVSAGGVDGRADDDPCSCTDGRCGTRPNSFARETRYVVFKLNKLNQKQLARLNDLLNVSGPEGDALPTVECVVVESDWPEYGPTWAAIEARVTGFSAPSHGEQVRASDLTFLAEYVLGREYGRALPNYEALGRFPIDVAEQYAAAPSAGSSSGPGEVQMLREALEFAVREQSGDLPTKQPSAWLLNARKVLAETASND